MGRGLFGRLVVSRASPRCAITWGRAAINARLAVNVSPALALRAPRSVKH